MKNYFEKIVSKITEKETQMSEEKNNEDIIIKYENDLSCFKNPVLVPRHIYQNIMDKFSCKAMFSSLYVLLKYCDSNGKVAHRTTMDLAKYFNYKDCRNIRLGLSKLEQLDIITIDRSTRPFKYYINDYHFKKGGFVVPQEYMGKIKNYKLKSLRLSWYYMARNFHSPLNKRKFNLKLDTLKNIVNADSYKEVINLAENLKNKFFSSIETILNGLKKGQNKLKVKFNKITLGILETSQKQLENVKQHFRFEDIKYIFQQLNIKPTLTHFKKAFNIIDKYSEASFITVKDNCENKRFKSSTGSVGYFEWMFEFAQDGGIQPQQ